MSIPCFDLKRQIESLRPELDEALAGLYSRGQYILGPAVERFEKDWAEYCETDYAVGVASGTDALYLIMKALGIGPGDEVIVPVLTAPPTAVAAAMTGASPVFADVESERLTLSPTAFAERITPRTKAVIPVHLYGCPVELDQILEIASGRGIKVIEDAAQAHGAEYDQKKVGGFGIAAAFSFYPTKNLGALGDAGMVVTSDEELYQKIKIMRDYGRTDSQTVSGPGVNSRLDELQAVALSVKLKYLDKWNHRRKEIANRYRDKLAEAPVKCPVKGDVRDSVFHQFVIRTRDREALMEHLSKRLISSSVHYPVLLCDQPAFRVECDFPNARVAVKEILSLPIFPELSGAEVDAVVSAILEFLRGDRSTDEP